MVSSGCVVSSTALAAFFAGAFLAAFLAVAFFAGAVFLAAASDFFGAAVFFTMPPSFDCSFFRLRYFFRRLRLMILLDCWPMVLVASGLIRGNNL